MFYSYICACRRHPINGFRLASDKLGCRVPAPIRMLLRSSLVGVGTICNALWANTPDPDQTSLIIGSLVKGLQCWQSDLYH